MKLNHNDEYIELTGDFFVLSSAPFNGGFKEAERIVNHTTPVKHKGTVRNYLKGKLELSSDEMKNMVGFVTAVDVNTAFTGQSESSEGSVEVVITAGVGDPVDPRYHNTINVIIYTDVNLSPTGLANLFIVITEAKVSALNELEVVKNGKEITGTPTDAIAVAKPRIQEKAEVNFSGTATDVGESVYELVKKGVKYSLGTNNGYSSDRNILARLSERGLSREDIVSSAFALLAGGREEDDLKEEFLDYLETYARDPNVHLLISSAFYLEKEKERLNLEGDPGRLVTDELIGIDIAEYIGGKNALFNFVRYDRKKPGILGKLPPFLDDAVGGLIAGTMTKLFEEKP